MKYVLVLANVNPLEPNTMMVVADSRKFGCSYEHFRSVISLIKVHELKEKGFRVEVICIEETIIKF